MAAPSSFRDPFWSRLATQAAQKVGVPAPLLVSVLLNGERSNNGQVSEAGAETPFQIIRATRDAVLKRDGIDAYLSPQNAAEAAALVLKDGLNWAKGRTGDDPQAQDRLAAGYYHAGGDTKGWGPRTLAYMDRVTKGIPEATPSVLQAGFADWLKANPASPAAPAAAEAKPDALAAGFGRFLAQGSPTAGADLIPRQAPGVQAPPATSPAVPDVPDGLAGKLVGAGEAGLSLGTGIVGGTLGLVGGAAGGLAGAILSGQFGTPEAAAAVERAAAEGAQALTYQPRTPAGQQYAGAVGEGMQQLLPVLPMTAELAALHAGAAPAAAAVGEAALAAPAAAVAAAKKAAPVAVGRYQALMERMQAARDEAAPSGAPGAAGGKPTAGTGGSVGAAGTDMATQRRALAADLPVPINDLTLGQATRSFEQQQFEREAAKHPELGAPLRERFADHNATALANFDTLVDLTGGAAADLRAVGRSVTDALQKKLDAAKNEVRVAYAKAEKAGDMEMPVRTDALATLLNDNRSGEALAPIIGGVKAELRRLDGAGADGDGLLIGGELPLRDMELVRQFASRFAGNDPNNIRMATIIKGAIDDATEGVGGELYKQARALRARRADEFEKQAVIRQLLATKPKTTDRAVAYEDVLKHSVLNGSLDDLTAVKLSLQTAGDAGKQAWRDLQGQTIQHLKDLAASNSATDIRGNRILSAAKLDRAIANLDADRKLVLLFGKKGAQQLRDINDLVKVIHTAPPGSVNSSNTASILLAALDMGVTSAAGIPLPVLSGLRMLAKHAKERTLARRIDEALGRKSSQKPTPRHL